MELMWDVVYVTWACLVLVAFFGESLWWLWVSDGPAGLLLAML